MDTTPAKKSTKELPEGFIDSLMEIIPENEAPELYRLLAGSDTYSLDVLVFFEAHVRYVADKLDDDQKARLDALFTEWKSDYTPPPAIATVKLYMAPAETDRQ